MGAGAGGDLDELEELAERINKTARTPVTTVRGDPLPEWLQPFDENLANNEGDEQKNREQQAAAPFAPASVAGAPTTSDDDDELVVDEEVIKEHDPDEQHGDRKIIKVHDPKLPTGGGGATALVVPSPVSKLVSPLHLRARTRA